jgi:predicted RecB family nuclease
MRSRSTRICPQGHRFQKSSGCSTCPKCEQERKAAKRLLAALSASARRALERKGVTTLKAQSRWSEQQVLALHGMGPSSIPKLQAALRRAGLWFAQSQVKTTGSTAVASERPAAVRSGRSGER